MDKYSKIFEITFRDVDVNCKLRMSALVTFMQEIANEHAKELGLDFLDEERLYYWVIVRAKMRLNQYPK